MPVIQVNSVHTMKIADKYPALELKGEYKSSGDPYSIRVFKSNKELCSKMEALTPGQITVLEVGKNAKGYPELTDVMPYVEKKGYAKGNGGGTGDGEKQFRTPDEIMRTSAIELAVQGVLGLTPKVKAEGFSALVTTMADDFYRYIKDSEADDSPFKDVPEEDVNPNAGLDDIPEPPEV